MKTILSLLTILLTTSVAIADKPVEKSKPSASSLKMNFGDSFGLKQRRTALPTDRETISAPKLLSANQVDRVVKDRVDELEYCWLKVPAAKRTNSSAIVKLSVEAIGIVQDVRVDGELPAGVGKCIAMVAARWRFPVGDQASELEYPIVLNQLAAR